MQCPNCPASFCIDCKESLHPNEFRCPQCLDIYEAQRREDHKALDELKPYEETMIDNLLTRCLKDVKPIIVDYVHRSYIKGLHHDHNRELEHANWAFRALRSELDRDHCAWCRRAWMANFHKVNMERLVMEKKS
jgi:hypothetical protein